MWDKFGRWITVLAAVIALALIVWLGVGKWVGFWLAIALVLPAWLMEHRSQTVRIKSHDADSVTFEFKHSEYAQEFARLNEVALRAGAK